MKQIKDYITIDTYFQKSVNLSLDLGDVSRVNRYIPTGSSLAVLKQYLESIAGQSKEHATILIGPYGKGKSHLLLVLLTILQGKQEGMGQLLFKIKKADEQCSEMIQKCYREHGPFLPVLVSGSGSDLNQSFLYALKEALERENMADIAPKSNYSEALKVLRQWKQSYPKVYRRWQTYLEEKGLTPENMEKRLDRMEEGAMEVFLECYPRLTAGSRFLPMVQSDALKIYQEVNRELNARYGYEGMIVVFDEFSKYVEGHGKEHFARDMKVLQDMCELADREGEEKLRLILVAHKSIHAYEKSIDKSVKDAFLGVEGRLKEVRFYVSARNNYELIADTLAKKEPEFSEEFSKYKVRTGFGRTGEQSYGLPCFSSLFLEYEEYSRVMETGCFPLTPACACILLHISERTAQNERTIFTFLTSREQGSLPRILEEFRGTCVGADAVYDYFRNLFRENADQPKIHNEWLKAEYALKRTKQEAEKKIIKAMALIRMVHREEELPVLDDSIRLSLGMEEEEYKSAMEHLKQEEIVIFRSSLGTYAFKNNVGVNIEKEIRAEAAKQPAEFPVCRYLQQVSELDYVLPKQHNQEKRMTRYFQYEFLRTEEFLQIGTASYLFEEQFADGKILALIDTEEIKRDAVEEKTRELQEERIVVLVPEKQFDKADSLRRLAAIYALKEQPAFIEENKVLLRELELYEEDIIFEVNASLERDFIPGNGGCLVFYRGEQPRRFGTDMEFNRFLSEICEDYYRFSPKVNHELLNIQKVSGQYLRARNKVVRGLLQGHAKEYQIGTSPECMVYRAAFVGTGILDNAYERDLGCSRILEEMDRFFLECIGKRKSFLELYQRLQGKDYGIRRGIMPLFLAQRLGLAEGVPVIYLQQKELEINENILNNVNDFPENYELYFEPESGKKEQYLKELERGWQTEGELCSTKQHRWMLLMGEMQKWYRSLPQYAMITNNFPPREQRAVRSFRNLLKRSELNPREFLFERIPALLAEEDGEKEKNLQETAAELLCIKELVDVSFSHLQRRTAEDIREVFGGKAQESLRGCLMSWRQRQGSAGREYILNKSSHEFLRYLEETETKDELEIMAQLSRILLDIHMEDWNDDTPEIFRRTLLEIREEVEHLSAHSEGKGQRTIILRDEQGQDIRRSYEADTGDSASSFLKNMIDEAMEDFEDTLETSQKVAVLVEVLQELLK